MGVKDNQGNFENVFNLVGGHGRYQWFCLWVVALQLIVLTYNHLGYIFLAAVPKHWCRIPALESVPWTLDQIQNLSIPKEYSNGVNLAEDDSTVWKYSQCKYYDLDYQTILEMSQGNYETAYSLAHNSINSSISGNNFPEEKSSLLAMPPSATQSPIKKDCQSWHYDTSIYQSTIVTQFDLVCGRRYLVASIQALYMIGAFTGTLIFGPLNDKFLGRRKSALIGIVLVLIGGFLSAFSTSYLMLVASRFVGAIGTAACMQAASIWILEHCDTKSRARMYCISSLFFGIGYAIMPIYAYFIRDWATLQLSFTLTTLSLLSFYWLFPESPRWLASHGRDEEAVVLLEKIAKFNKVSPKPSRAELLKMVRQCHLQENQESGDGVNDRTDYESDVECKQSMALSTGISTTTTTGGGKSPNCRKQSCLGKVFTAGKNFSALVSTPQLRRISFVMWLLFVAVAFVYYGFAFSSGNLTSNPYLLVSLGALMEVPAAVFPIPFLGWWGRRPTIVACYMFTGLAALAIAITPASYEAVRTVLSMIGKLFVASAFTILYLVVGEIYPTVARSTGQAASTLMGRLGSISVPYVADMLTTVYPDLPSFIFGIVSLVAGFVALLIPEMKNVHMKDQVYEYEDSKRKRGTSQEKTNENITKFLE